MAPGKFAFAGAAGIFTTGQPALDDWKSVQDYDRSIPDLRLEEGRPILQDWFAENAPGIVHIQVQTKGKKKTEEVDPQDWVEVHMMEIPGTTQRWVRPDLGARTQKPKAFDWSRFGVKAVEAPKGARTHLSLPADVDGEELISAIQNQVLQPRPKFSIGDSLIAHRFHTLIGLAFLTAGLFSLGWYVRSVLRAKRAHSQQMA